MITRNNTAQILWDLKPLIAENLRKRELLSFQASKRGEAPPFPHDKWFWADELALDLGARTEYYERVKDYAFLMGDQWNEAELYKISLR